MKPARAAGRLRAAGVLAPLLALCGLGVVYARSEARLERRYDVSAAAPEIPEGEIAQRQGRYLVRVLGQCDLCHGADLGGARVADEPALGTLWAPNLTSGGDAATLAPADWTRAIRFGLGRDGRPLLLMPAQHLRRFGDGDIGAIVAYLRSLPPVRRDIPARRAGWKTRLAIFLDLAPGLIPAEEIDFLQPSPVAPLPARSAEYGAYLVDVGACRVCHHESLAGGPHPLALPGEQPTPNLTPAGPLRDVGEAEFIAMLRGGRTPQGRALDPRRMPWPAFAELGDVELSAIWLYLRSLQPRATGSLR